MYANGSRIVCLVVLPALISLSCSVLQMLGGGVGRQPFLKIELKIRI
jgi:hypothetical protein